MRTLAIDLGGKRVGLAISDQGGHLATPLEVLQVNAPTDALEPILSLVRREAVERLAVGLPLNMDDSFGPAAKQAIRWGRELGQLTGLPVIFIDERLSSFQAEEQLADRRRLGQRLTRGKKKERRDALAAAAFLQAFLDGRIAAYQTPPAADSNE
jgi:putative holliday junction resolvase